MQEEFPPSPLGREGIRGLDSRSDCLLCSRATTNRPHPEKGPQGQPLWHLNPWTCELSEQRLLLGSILLCPLHPKADLCCASCYRLLAAIIAETRLFPKMC